MPRIGAALSLRVRFAKSSFFLENNLSTAKSRRSCACATMASNSSLIGITLSIALDGVDALTSAIMSLTM